MAVNEYASSASFHPFEMQLFSVAFRDDTEYTISNGRYIMEQKELKTYQIKQLTEILEQEELI